MKARACSLVIDVVAVAAVRPPRGLRHPCIVMMGADFPADIENATDHPSETGFDRLANAGEVSFVDLYARVA